MPSRISRCSSSTRSLVTKAVDRGVPFPGPGRRAAFPCGPRPSSRQTSAQASAERPGGGLLLPQSLLRPPGFRSRSFITAPKGNLLYKILRLFARFTLSYGRLSSTKGMAGVGHYPAKRGAGINHPPFLLAVDGPRRFNAITVTTSETCIY